MRKVYYLIVFLLIPLVAMAQPWHLRDVNNSPADDDTFMFMDKSDTTSSEHGTLKQIEWSAIRAASGNGGTIVTGGTYVYIAYAADDSGTSFTTTFNPDLDYIAIKRSSTEISPLTASHFAGLWKNYKGADGSPGTGIVWKGEYSAVVTYDQYDAVNYEGNAYIANTETTGDTPGTDPEWDEWLDADAIGLQGDSAYVYIAYASDSDGTDFTTTFNSALDYIAVLSTDTEIETPEASDFAGLWKLYKGADGATGSPGEGFSDCTPSEGDCGLEIPENEIDPSWTPQSGYGGFAPVTGGAWKVWDTTNSLWVDWGEGPSGSGSLPTATAGQVAAKGVAAWEAKDIDDVTVVYSETEYTSTAATVAGHLEGIDDELASIKADIEAILDALYEDTYNRFFFANNTPATYPYYSDTGTLTLSFDITCQNTTYSVDEVDARLDGADPYDIVGVLDTGDTWEWEFTGGSALAEGSYDFEMEACDDQLTPVCGESDVRVVVVDLTDPVVDLTTGTNIAEHDGSGNQSFTLRSDMVTETNAASGRYRITEGEGTPSAWTAWNPPFTDASVSMPESEEDITIEVEITDLAARTGDDSIIITYSSEDDFGLLFLSDYEDADDRTQWSASGDGDWDFDCDSGCNANSPLAGTYSLHRTGSGTGAIAATVSGDDSGNTDLYVRVAFRMTSIPTLLGEAFQVQIVNSESTSIAELSIYNNGSGGFYRLYAKTSDNSSSFASISGSYDDALYYFVLRYTKGSRVYSYLQDSTGTELYSASRSTGVDDDISTIRFNSSASRARLLIDSVEVRTDTNWGQ